MGDLAQVHDRERLRSHAESPGARSYFARQDVAALRVALAPPRRAHYAAARAHALVGVNTRLHAMSCAHRSCSQFRTSQHERAGNKADKSADAAASQEEAEKIPRTL